MKVTVMVLCVGDRELFTAVNRGESIIGIMLEVVWSSSVESLNGFYVTLFCFVLFCFVLFCFVLF